MLFGSHMLMHGMVNDSVDVGGKNDSCKKKLADTNTNLRLEEKLSAEKKKEKHAFGRRTNKGK